MKRILYVVEKWANGGVESVITKYCKKLHMQYNISIFTFEKDPSVFDSIIDNCGIKFYIAPKVQSNIVVKNLKKMKAFCEICNMGYDIVHYNTSFSLPYLFCFIVKSRNKNIKIVLHSHGDNINPPHLFSKKMFHFTVKKIFANVPDFGIACSDSAGKWLFDKSFLKHEKYLTLMNPIEIDKMKYDPEKREDYRRKFGVNDNVTLIGTIGRFEHQKNPEFILKILEQLHLSGLNYKFIWVGKGTDKEKIRILSTEKGLSEGIIFIDYVTDVSGLLNALDLFILPSKYEGLPLVLIEAQINGLPCLTSDCVTKETDISGNIMYLSIDDSELWRKEIAKYYPRKISADKTNINVNCSAFDEEFVTQKLNEIYERIMV